MASRTQYNQLSMDRNTIEFYGIMAMGSAALTSTDAVGFSVARTGTGTYDVTMDDNYFPTPANYVSAGSTTSPLMSLSICQIDTGNTQVLTPVITSNFSNTTKKFTFKLNSAAATPADPANGTTILLNFTMRSAGSPRKGT